MKKIHRPQEQQPAEARAREIGEIDAAENPLRLEKHGAEVEGAGQEREHVEQEVAEQPPLLRRVGDEEDGVEGYLLRDEVGRHRQRTEQHQRDHRHPLPVPLEPALAHAHDGAGQAEAEHGEAHHQRAEMRPAADREQTHDADLQRDHRAGHEADRQIQEGCRPAARRPPRGGSVPRAVMGPALKVRTRRAVES